MAPQAIRTPKGPHHSTLKIGRLPTNQLSSLKIVREIRGKERK